MTDTPSAEPRSALLRHPVRWTISALVVLGVVSLLLVGSVLLWSRGDLEAGKSSLERARKALTAGNLGEAKLSFQQAAMRFETAADRTGGVIGRVATWVPFLGNDVDVADALADAGVDLSAAGTEVVDAVIATPGGVDGLVPSGGRMRIRSMEALAPALGRATDHADAAFGRISDAPGAFLFGPIATARWDAQAQITEVAEAFKAASLIVEGLPAFAGAQEPARYLVVAQNPAELRGSGGLWGAYAILSFDRGKPSFSQVGVTTSLPYVPADEISAPNPDYPGIYARFGGAASWQNMNMTPDFPSAARAAIGNFEAGTGQKLDGVIAADPFALQAMLKLTGPVTVPGTNLKIDQENVVAVTTNKAYTLFQRQGQTARKEVLGTVAKDVFARFLSMSGQGTQRIRALADSISAGHLAIYSTDPSLQHGLEVGRLDGGLTVAGDGDLVAVTVNNAGGDKIDYYSTRQVSLAVRLGGDQEAIERLGVRLRNDAPTSGQPRYVIGPFLDGLQPGDQLSLVSVTCHEPCPLGEVRRDGTPISVESGTEIGSRWYRTPVLVPAGRTGAVSMVWKTDGVWSGSSAAGAYRLTFLGQTTIRPTTLDLSIEAPAGTSITWTSPSMKVDGNLASWTGRSGRVMTFEIRFSAPLPVRWWRDLTA